VTHDTTAVRACVHSAAMARDHLEHLRNVPLFSSCTKSELQKIAKATTETTLAAGATLVEQGQAGREAFVIADGTATVRRNGRKVATLGAGSIVGELSLLDRGPRTATVTADGPMRVLVIGQREFTALFDEVPALAHKLLASLAGRVRELDRQTFG
jgi:CRP/FNR family cyclic AMP-dependent transcriptional regulator